MPHNPAQNMTPMRSQGRNHPRQGGLSPPGYMALFDPSVAKEEKSRVLVRVLVRVPTFQKLARKLGFS
jgi:hypothetical protein